MVYGGSWKYFMKLKCFNDDFCKFKKMFPQVSGCSLEYFMNGFWNFWKFSRNGFCKFLEVSENVSEVSGSSWKCPVANRIHTLIVVCIVS